MNSASLSNPTAVRTYDDETSKDRHAVLTRFNEQPAVKYFVVQVRRGRLLNPTILSVLDKLEPTEDSKIDFGGLIECGITMTETRAWSLGTIGTNDHRLHITAEGAVMSLSTHLTYDGKTVCDARKRWPLKALVPFDVSSLDDDLVGLIVDRIEALATQAH